MSTSFFNSDSDNKDCSSKNSLESLDLKRFLWRKRVIVTFSKSKDNPQLQSIQAEINEKRVGFKNRHLVHINVNSASEEYRLVLIGKDGGVKMDTKRGSSISLQKIFDKIDTMPMRRSEMRFDSKS